MRVRRSVAVLGLVVAVGVVSSGPAKAEVVEHWEHVHAVPGWIVDVVPTALVYRTGTELHHVDVGKVDRTVSTVAEHSWPAQLTGDGVVFAESTGVVGRVRIRSWTVSGGATDLGVVPHAVDDVFSRSAAVVALEGDWVALGRLPGGPGLPGLVVRNLVTGQERTVTSVVPSEVDVAADGTVVFVADGSLMMDRAGVTSVLVEAAADTALIGPRTDGTTTAVARVVGEIEPFGLVQSSLVATDGTNETTLVAAQACRLAALASDCDWYFGYPRAGPEYLVDRGVTAWVTTTTSGVARRVGAGPSLQVFPLPAFLDEIGPGGEVLLLRRYSASGEILWSEHPHVVDPDGTVTALHAPAGSDVAFAGPHLVAWATGDLFLLEPPGGPAPQLWEQPDPTTVLLGGYLELSATFGGSPVPDITWERSTDGSTWVPLFPHVAGQDPTWSPYTSTLFLAVTAADVPYRWYRAVAVSSEGSASTDPVSVTVRPPVIVPGAVTVTEATATAQLRVTLSDPVRVTAGARWRTVVVPGLVDQATPDVDYTAASGTISFPPGAQVAIIPVAILPDAVPEADERIIVQVGAPTNASIGGIWGLGSITITDDD